jgi:GxxExxY protein
MHDLESLAQRAIDCGFAIHRDLGPGLLESVYENLLATSLEQHGLSVERQKPISFSYSGRHFVDAFRADLLVGGRLLIELKSVEKIAPVHTKQVLTYIRLLEMPLGLLLNFGAATFKEGIERVLNTRIDMSAIELTRRKVPLRGN